MKGGIPEATNLIVDLRENHGVFCSIVVYPVIPKGEIILRVIPTAAHTLEDVNYTLERTIVQSFCWYSGWLRISSRRFSAPMTIGMGSDLA